MKKFVLPNKEINSGQAVRKASDYLSLCGVDDAKIDSRLIMRHVTAVDTGGYINIIDKELSGPERSRFEEMVNKRGKRIPLQHLFHEAWFYGRRFYVDEHVLIPRMDTEVLAVCAMKYLKRGMRVLDLCTGSGCIAVTLAAQSDVYVLGTDISEKAVETAKKNALSYFPYDNLRCTFLVSDMFEKIDGKFDLIVSNPPYIRTGEIQNLQDEVKNHDPFSALDGGEDGLNFYRIIAEESRLYLKNGGRLCVEIGFGQKNEIAKLLRRGGFSDIEIINDLNCIPRVITALKPTSYF